MRQRILCWLHRHPEVRCSTEWIDWAADIECVSGTCIACGREFLWTNRRWSPPGSYRQAQRDAQRRTV